MTPLTLGQIEAAVRASWGDDTSYASPEYMARGGGEPSRGQCGTTALVLQDLLGGDLMIADVELEGRTAGVHYWNVMPGGVEIDLTRDQFVPAESLVRQRRVTARRGASTAGERPLRVLERRVGAALRVGAPDPHRPLPGRDGEGGPER